MKISLNFDRINRAKSQAFQEVALAMSEEFTRGIEATVWDWPRGESPRDIVDKGDLKKSLKFALGNKRATYMWATDHSQFVRTGVVLKNGTILPGRDWIGRALRLHPPTQLYQAKLGGYL